MKVEYFKEYSVNLSRDMEFKVFGHSGRLVLVFPSQDGRFYDYENNGMVEAASDFINSGKIQLFHPGSHSQNHTTNSKNQATSLNYIGGCPNTDYTGDYSC